MPVDIVKPLKKFLPHLLRAREENLNEADTVQRLIKVFEEVLGFDGITEISREAQMKGKYVDVVLKIDGVIRLLVEAKAAAETLRDRHIEQAFSYASRNNHPWVLLTNGVDWNLYHLTFSDGIEYERAFSVDLSDDTLLDDAAARLGLLHRLAIKKGELEDFWNKTRALSAGSIGRALFQEDVLLLIRREIRRDEGLLIDPEDLAKAIQEMLSPEARERIGPLRIRKKAAKARRTTAQAQAVPGDDGPPAEERDQVAEEQADERDPVEPPSPPSAGTS